jgi:hypothetical protein
MRFADMSNDPGATAVSNLAFLPILKAAKLDRWHGLRQAAGACAFTQRFGSEFCSKLDESML